MLRSVTVTPVTRIQIDKVSQYQVPPARSPEESRVDKTRRNPFATGVP